MTTKELEAKFIALEKRFAELEHKLKIQNSLGQSTITIDLNKMASSGTVSSVPFMPSYWDGTYTISSYAN